MSWRARVGRILNSCKREFGCEVSHTPAAGGGPHTRTGIFNDQYAAVDPDTGFVVSTLDPNLGIKLKDWTPRPVQGDRIAVDIDEPDIDTATYRVREVKPDGEGGAVVLLDKMKNP